MHLFRAYFNRWSLAALIIAVLVLVPLCSIIGLGFTEATGQWKHISDNLFSEYLWNSATLALLVLAGVFLLGTCSAFIVAFYNFPGKRFFEWALVLPLSIPAYLMAFSYAEFTGYSGWLSQLFNVHADLMSFKGAVFIFCFSLYPYVYLPVKVFFKEQGLALVEVSNSLGLNTRRAFFKTLLPIGRPAITGGLFLVLMEVLNDYGLVKYFGIPTLTSGIFRAWFSSGDMYSALRLSAMLLFTVLLMVFLERYYRRNYKFSFKNSRKLQPRKLGNWKAIAALLFCSLVFTLGFVVPIAEMLSGVAATWRKVISTEFFMVVGNSFYVAAISAALAVALALILEFTIRANKQNKINYYVVFLSGLGYAIPGAIIAIGVLYPALEIDKWLYSIRVTDNLLFTSGVGILIYAVVIRFLAVSLQSLHTGYATMSPSLADAARGLGYKPFRILWSIDVPLLRNFLLSGFILVFVDVLKELPLTLILRPFNFDTLATKAFSLASDELLRESANPSIIIVASGLMALYALNRLMKR